MAKFLIAYKSGPISLQDHMIEAKDDHDATVYAEAECAKHNAVVEVNQESQFSRGWYRISICRPHSKTEK